MARHCNTCYCELDDDGRLFCHQCRASYCPACIYQHGCNCPHCMQYVGRDAMDTCHRCGMKTCWNCRDDHLCRTDADVYARLELIGAGS